MYLFENYDCAKYFTMLLCSISISTMCINKIKNKKHLYKYNKMEI